MSTEAQWFAGVFAFFVVLCFCVLAFRRRSYDDAPRQGTSFNV